MIIIHPCNCGGIPYLSPYAYDSRQAWTDEMYIVRCYRCGNVGMLEYTEDDAINEWNLKNTKYVAG